LASPEKLKTTQELLDMVTIEMFLLPASLSSSMTSMNHQFQTFDAEDKHAPYCLPFPSLSLTLATRSSWGSPLSNSDVIDSRLFLTIPTFDKQA
jgi:hypothetical protein